MDTTPTDWQALNAESLDAWDTNADFWDAHMGDEGNDFQKTLVGIPTLRLLNLQPGETVLDIACGNGLFARRMAEVGARVVAFDFSARLIERAQARNEQYAGRIEYHVLDATDEEGLRTLGEGRFNAAVSTMALMDMPVLQPLFSALSKLIKPGGRFVFSVMHPCFNTDGTRLVMEESDQDGEIVTEYAVKVVRYRTLTPTFGIGIRNQPVPQRYFHRPLHQYLQAGFDAGFVLDGLEEPTFHTQQPKGRAVSWDNLPEIPPALIARMRIGNR